MCNDDFYDDERAKLNNSLYFSAKLQKFSFQYLTVNVDENDN